MLQSTTDSGAAISLLRYSTYKRIEDYYKIPKPPATAKLNTADVSPMSAIGMTALHLTIAEFKFTHNFIICNQLPEMELILALTYKESSQSPMPGTKKKNCYIQKEGNFLTYTKDCEQKATICTVKLTLKIPL